MYRLNVLERLGREEGSQIVVYGMGGGDSSMESAITGSTAGSMAGNRPPARTSGSGETT